MQPIHVGPGLLAQVTPEEVEAARAEAVARYQGKLSRLREHPEVRAMAESDHRFEEARAAVHRACLPLRAAFLAHVRAHPSGYPLGSEADLEGQALLMAVHDTELRTYEAHGYRIQQPPQSPRSLRVRLEALGDHIAIWQPESKVAHATDIDALWEQAVQIRTPDRDLPELPARSETDNAGIASLLQWCDRCREAQYRRLGDALAEFCVTLEATTIGRSGGDREVAGSSHGVLLSEATSELLAALAATEAQLLPDVVQLAAHTGAEAAETPMCRTAATSVPRWGASDSDPALVAALESVRDVLRSPDAPENGRDSASPGADQNRWRSGDLVRRKDLARLARAADLFALRARQPGGAGIEVARRLVPPSPPVGGATDNSTKEKMTKATAEKLARKLMLKEPTFRDLTQRGWAERIGCSAGLVGKLRSWEAVMAQRREKSPGPRPRVREPLADVARGRDPAEIAADEEERRAAELKRLSAEQARDCRSRHVP